MLKGGVVGLATLRMLRTVIRLDYYYHSASRDKKEK